MSSSNRLSGVRALVTGGASGLGLAVSERFSAEGSKVAICDIDEAALAAAKASNPTWLCQRTDVSSESEVALLFGRIRAEWGGLDCLVNNAGIAGPTAPIEEIDASVWQKVFAINVMSAVFCTRLAVPLLKEKGGTIIIMSSVAGRLGVPFRTPYASTKWALVGLTKSLALELGTFKIRVNAILPGLTRGARLDGVIQARAKKFGRSFDEQKAFEVGTTALGEMGDPQDIANAALFLASSEGRVVTGVALPVDAGLESASFR
jgi:NAD(P)-dependent dehydrogenase (short-subunit alcohol dehydrogenase family)